MSVEHVLQAKDRLEAIAQWYCGVLQLPPKYRRRHYAVVHSDRCRGHLRCTCVPIVVRVPGEVNT